MRFSKSSRQNKKESGTLLIVVLWVLALLSIFVLAMGYTTRQRLRTVQYLEDHDRLRLIAKAAVLRAVSVLNQKRPEDERGYHALNGRWSNSPSDFYEVAWNGGTYTLMSWVDPKHPAAFIDNDTKREVRYGMTDEERKINLNKTNSPQILTNLFQHGAGISHAEAYKIALSLLDWRDEDDFPYDLGAESFYYKSKTPPYIPKNADLGSIEEILPIKGITPEIFRRVKPYISVHSTGKININTASRVVLRALNFSESLTSKILSYRAGPDGIEGTPDDGIFKDLGAIVDNLNQEYSLSSEEVASLESFIGSGILVTESQRFTIRATVRLGTHKPLRLTVHCIVDRSGAILQWNEFFHSG